MKDLKVTAGEAASYVKSYAKDHFKPDTAECQTRLHVARKLKKIVKDVEAVVKGEEEETDATVEGDD